MSQEELYYSVFFLGGVVTGFVLSFFVHAYFERKKQEIIEQLKNEKPSELSEATEKLLTNASKTIAKAGFSTDDLVRKAHKQTSGANIDPNIARNIQQESRLHRPDHPTTRQAIVLNLDNTDEEVTNTLKRKKQSSKTLKERVKEVFSNQVYEQR